MNQINAKTNQITVSGKYNSAKIFTTLVEDSALEQIQQLCDQEFVSDCKIRIMPDVHAGAGCTIGTTIAWTVYPSKIVPSLVGVDIGCQVKATKINVDNVDFEEFDDAVKELIPSGTNILKDVSPFWMDNFASRLNCKDNCDIERAKRSLGTLGGGNHFIALDRDSSGSIWLVTHSGSRHLGKEVCEYYQKKAYERLNTGYKEQMTTIIQELKQQGKQKEIQNEISKIKSNYQCKIPEALAYVTVDDLCFDYLEDMTVCQEFAIMNNNAIHQTLLKRMGWKVEETFTTMHNYIDIENKILRKGAVSAQYGEKLIIPINMRDGSLICIGKGNPDWNFSTPHGAGRMMSRSEARRSLSLEDFKETMLSTYSSTVEEATIDEAPMAYKPMGSIINAIGDTVEVIDNIKEIYNFKATN